MNACALKVSSILVLGISLLLVGVAQSQTIGGAPKAPAIQAPARDVPAAVQAIQQAPDPSAAVAAYANGVAADRKDPAIHSAYISRMIDFGLPELAYRQAQTLTALDPKNGLAWGVVAHVEARRGNMDDAMSAISQAGMYAPDQVFVQRTAGEILAWYDTRADQTKISEQTKASFARLREKLGGHNEFASAYDVAKKAYQSENTAQTSLRPPAGTGATGTGSTVVTNPPAVAPQDQAPPAPTAPPPAAYVEPYATGPQTVYAPNAAPPYYYYDDYYYGWGPGWVAPAPSWWWYPNGFFVGFDFFPFSTAFVFDGHDHHHHHDGHHGHDNFAHHSPDGQFFHGQNGRRVAQSGVPSSRNSAAFFGSHSRPDPTVRSGNSASTQFRASPSIVSPGPAIPQRGSIGRPGTSSAAPAPPLAAPNSAVRQQRTSSATIPRTSTAAGSSTLVPSSLRGTASTAHSPPLAVPNSAVNQRSTAVSVPRTAGTAASASSLVPSAARGTPASTPSAVGRPSSSAVWNSPASTPVAPRTSVSTATPAARPAPGAVMPNPFTARSASRPIAQSNPALSIPNSAVRSSPPLSVPNSGIRSSIPMPRSSTMSVTRSAPMVVPHSAPMAAPRSAPSFGGMSHMGGSGRVGGFSSGGGHGGSFSGGHGGGGHR